MDKVGHLGLGPARGVEFGTLFIETGIGLDLACGL